MLRMIMRLPVITPLLANTTTNQPAIGDIFQLAVHVLDWTLGAPLQIFANTTANIVLEFLRNFTFKAPSRLLFLL